MISRCLRQADDCKDDHIAIATFFSEIGLTLTKRATFPDGIIHATFVEVTMSPKTLIIPERKRVLAPPFAWIDRRFLFNGFMAQLNPQENLLYFFLVLAADRDGLSFYNYDKICQVLQLAVDDYVQARNGLIEKKLIAFDGRQFQVLTLPTALRPPASSMTRTVGSEREAQALANIFARLAHGADQEDGMASSR
jgi:hypothetical protein